MKFNRSSGILLHPTSLPGSYGIGDLGPQAYKWIDFLVQTGCSLWQVLPLGPTGYGDSPYQCFSSFAGNPYLISPGLLLDDGLLIMDDLVNKPDFPVGRVDYGQVINWKIKVLDQAAFRFLSSADGELQTGYENFRSQNCDWLEDFALFMALKESHGGAPWYSWDPALRERSPQAISQARQDCGKDIQRHIFRQFIFNWQWGKLREYTNDRGIQIIGDIPIFVAHDSADVWAHPDLYYLDEDSLPTVVAGVPPDYFSPTGQLWGNPIYNWEFHQENGFKWWLNRLKAVLDMVDIVRLDHFRGFSGYWEIMGDAETAEDGRWKPGPGKIFFEHVLQEFGELPIIAEDLGVITPEVEELRDYFNLPGMKILQFSFEGTPKDPFLPHNYLTHCIAYTGTHDNDTALGWYERVSEKTKDFYRRYIASSGENVSWEMIRAIWASVAIFSLAPMQDFLALGNEGRMNYPGNPSGNWTWRMPEEAIDESLADRIRELNYLYDRENPIVIETEEMEIPGG